MSRDILRRTSDALRDQGRGAKLATLTAEEVCAKMYGDARDFASNADLVRWMDEANRHLDAIRALCAGEGKS